MTTVTLTRELAQQVLTELERISVHGVLSMHNGSPAWIIPMKVAKDCEQSIAIMQSAIDAPAHPEVQPVAYRVGKELLFNLQAAKFSQEISPEYKIEPLYTAPQAPARETPEQLLQHIAEFGELQNQAPARELTIKEIGIMWASHVPDELSHNTHEAARQLLVSAIGFSRAVLAASKAPPVDALADLCGPEAFARNNSAPTPGVG